MKKQIEISFIDNTIFYNYIQRGSSSSKNKNNFVIYDMSGGECLTDEFQNFISINEDISKLLIQSKDEAIKLTEIQKILPKDKEELFSKSKRYFNFLLVQPKDSDFLNLFNSVVLSFSKTSTSQSEEEKMNTQLLYSGQIKIEYDQFTNELEKRLKENPDIEARCRDSVLNWRKAITLYKVLRNNKIIEIHVLRQSSQSFFTSYPFMHNYFVSLNSASQQTYPNDILCNRLYFGNWKHASNEEIINSIGITHIVNMTCEVDNYFASNRKSSITPSNSSNLIPPTMKFSSSLLQPSLNHQQSKEQDNHHQQQQQYNQKQVENKHLSQQIDQTIIVQQLLLEELPTLSINQSPRKLSNISLTTSTITTTTQNNNSISTTTTTTTTTTPIPYTKAKSINTSTTPKNITYLKINIDDEDSSNIQQHFKETYQFISSALKKPNTKVLIHCAQGKSRSASIVCMYLMRTFKWSFDHTLKYVQDRREVANPNYGFVEQLKNFENLHFMFDGESLDELTQSLKQANTLLELCSLEVSESPKNNDNNEKNVKKQQIQDFNQLTQDLQVVQ